MTATHYPWSTMVFNFDNFRQHLGMSRQKTVKTHCRARVKFDHITEQNVTCSACRQEIEAELKTIDSLLTAHPEYKEMIQPRVDQLNKAVQS